MKGGHLAWTCIPEVLGLYSEMNNDNARVGVVVGALCYKPEGRGFQTL
jgi:hypothetical protein